MILSHNNIFDINTLNELQKNILTKQIKKKTIKNNNTIELEFSNGVNGMKSLECVINNMNIDFSYIGTYSLQTVSFIYTIHISESVRLLFNKINKYYDVPKSIDILIKGSKKTNDPWTRIIDVCEKTVNNITLNDDLIDKLAFIVLTRQFYISDDSEIFTISWLNHAQINQLSCMEAFEDITKNYKTLKRAKFNIDTYQSVKCVKCWYNDILEVPLLEFYEQKSDLKIIYHMWEKTR
jgi:hypothetical protein